MADELSQLDEIVESDILDALGEKTTPQSSNEVSATTEQDNNTDENLPETLEDEIKIEDFIEESDEENIDQNSAQDDEIKIEDFIEESEETPSPNETIVEDETDTLQELEDEPQIDEATTQKTIEVESSSIASIINELLKNKTIEITIKIKD